MNTNHQTWPGERLVDAREAAYCLNLPTYWLTHPKERVRRQVPH